MNYSGIETNSQKPVTHAFSSLYPTGHCLHEKEEGKTVHRQKGGGAMRFIMQ